MAYESYEDNARVTIYHFQDEEDKSWYASFELEDVEIECRNCSVSYPEQDNKYTVEQRMPFTRAYHMFHRVIKEMEKLANAEGICLTTPPSSN